MASNYKLRASIYGHEKDVRALFPAYYPEGSIISASRDISARVWVPNEMDPSFREGLVLSGHTNFVVAVCMMPPSDTYPQGLIVTGSNDKTILAYTLDSPQPVYKLEGHVGTVCTLAAGKFGTLLSGSWDTTAKVWLNQKCVMTLEGHSAAVWVVAVMPEQGLMLSGSADKLIKMWRAGKCERTFTGHEDCVRGLAVLNSSEFLSSSNDSSIRRWMTSGECLHTYYGHSNFVYSIAILPNGEDFVSAGEDRTLRVWKGGNCVQTIPHATQSVWCVCVLQNGDIATGASDGVIRVFSSSPERQAAEEEQKEWQDLVANSSIPSQVGDLNMEELPGPEALLNPGKRDGQTLMVKRGANVEAHQWSATEQKWMKIGDVVGSSGSSQSTSGKQLYEGKEYDYVFSVDIEEGKPPLKLPFNTTEDPWMAAQTFLHKHNLSQLFLDQVANFILENTKGVTLGQTSAGGADPFTGGNRYVPGSGTPAPAAPTAPSSDPFTGGGRHIPSYDDKPSPFAASANQATGADPFTGGSSYRPSSSNGAPSATPQPASVPSGDGSQNQYFPKTSYLTFDQAKPEAIIGKLKEFNGGADNKVEDGGIDSLSAMMTGGQVTAQQVNILWTLLQWPDAINFPAIDVLRLSIKNPVVAEHFCSEKDGQQFIEYLLKGVSATSPTANKMLVLRTICNAFVQPLGERLILNHRDQVLTALLGCKDSTNKNIQIALSSILLNFSVAYRSKADFEAKAQCLSVLAEAILSQTDNEANFRLLVALGTFVTGDKNGIAIAKSLEVTPAVMKLRSIQDPKKVGECATFVASILS